MTIGFMALVAAMLAERIGVKLGVGYFFLSSSSERPASSIGT